MTSLPAIETSFRESLQAGPTAILSILPKVFQNWKHGWTEILLQAYFENSDQEVAGELLSFIRQLDGKDSAQAIATHLDWTRNPFSISLLLAACWESHMDFSPVIGKMTENAIHATYAVGIEMMTLIENHLGNLSMEERNYLIEVIEPRIQVVPDDTKPLWEAIYEVVKAY